MKKMVAVALSGLILMSFTACSKPKRIQRLGFGNSAYAALSTILLQWFMKRGQLPVFIPNYYRGAYRQFPKTAGRSSHLFNTGTAPWVYRFLIDGLFGLHGKRDGLQVRPQLPSDWHEVTVKRSFRGAQLHIEMKREDGVTATEVYLDGELAREGILKGLESGGQYNVLVKLPAGNA